MMLASLAGTKYNKTKQYRPMQKAALPWTLLSLGLYCRRHNSRKVKRLKLGKTPFDVETDKVIL